VTKLTRRSFLKQTSVSAATLGLLPAIPALAAIPHSPEAAAPEMSATSTGPMVVHVSDIARGEVTLLVGAREVVFRDRRLVARLIKAARQGG
jgi:hypothetical protein